VKRAATVIMFAAGLAGCGSSSSSPSAAPASVTVTSSPSVSSPAPATPKATPTVEPSGSSLALEEAIAKTGCTGYELAAEAAPFAATYGTCRWMGNRLQLYTFDDEASREKFLDLSAQYGAPRSSLVIAGMLVAALDRQTDRALLKTTLLG
jgi:hypothetical protein